MPELTNNLNLSATFLRAQCIGMVHWSLKEKYVLPSHTLWHVKLVILDVIPEVMTCNVCKRYREKVLSNPNSLVQNRPIYFATQYQQIIWPKKSVSGVKPMDPDYLIGQNLVV